MRKGIYSIFAAVVLICLFAVSSAKAQSTNRVVLQADIPFEFTIGKVTLPAGEYTVRSVSDSSDILQLRSADGHSVLVQMNPDLARLGMAQNIVQRLLQHAEAGSLHSAGRPHIRPRGVNMHLPAGRRGLLPAIRGYRGVQA